MFDKSPLENKMNPNTNLSTFLFIFFQYFNHINFQTVPLGLTKITQSANLQNMSALFPLFLSTSNFFPLETNFSFHVKID